MGKLRHVIGMLLAGQPLPRELGDHPLKGEWKPSRDGALVVGAASASAASRAPPQRLAGLYFGMEPRFRLKCAAAVASGSQLCAGQPVKADAFFRRLEC